VANRDFFQQYKKDIFAPGAKPSCRPPKEGLQEARAVVKAIALFYSQLWLDYAINHFHS